MTPPTVISVENLSKVYRLGQIGGGTLSEDLNRWWARFRGRPDPYLKIGQADHSNRDGERIWALRDVSFTAQQGDILGIIGRNGAGKSTLLKILSRITAPTSGQVKVKGRVASLLEVGTGFHPDLTGRENVYLNGAILGMTRDEICRKLDAIVEFAEVQKFIDTPVKRYSSGMYVRLAFAVAAHLDPEILMVDEVLAVGDAEFQAKCVGKMGEVAREGRTVLFVSHNMQSIQALCSRCVQMAAGSVVASGVPSDVVLRYLSQASTFASERRWDDANAPGNAGVSLGAVRVRGPVSSSSGVFVSSGDLFVELEFVARSVPKALCVGFDLMSSDGETVLRSYQTDLPAGDWLPARPGRNVWSCRIPAGFLNAGVFRVAPRIGVHNMYWIVNCDPVVQFEVVLDHGVSPFWNSLDGRSRPGFVAPILTWTAQNLEHAVDDNTSAGLEGDQRRDIDGAGVTEVSGR